MDTSEKYNRNTHTSATGTAAVRIQIHALVLRKKETHLCNPPLPNLLACGFQQCSMVCFEGTLYPLAGWCGFRAGERVSG